MPRARIGTPSEALALGLKPSGQYYDQRFVHLEHKMKLLEITRSTELIEQVRLSRGLNVELNSRVLYDIEVSNIGRAFDMERG